MTTPSQVLDLHVGLEADLSRPIASEFVSGVLASLWSQDNGERGWARDAELTPAAHAAGEAGADHMRSLLRGAHNYHVQAEMTDLVIHTANELADTARWQRRFLPTEVGFAYFDKPIRAIDVAGRESKVHAYLWGPARIQLNNHVESVIAVYEFSDIHDPDQITREMMAQHEMTYEQFRQMGRLQLWHQSFYTDDERMGPPTLTPPEDYAARIAAAGHVPSESTNAKRIFAAYIRLMNQTIIKVSEAKPERAAVKRATRRNMPSRVSTVTLRRVEYVGDTHEDTNVDWQHRWIVRGHHAWRRCGADHPLAEPDGEGGYRCFVYINPYLKGPADKPLLLTEKVYDLAR